MEKNSVLPQTFYNFECNKDLIDNVLSLIKKEKYVKVDPKKNLSSHSLNSTLHKQKEYAELIDWIYKCINELKEDLKLQCERFTITQCWSNCAEFGQKHPEHLHPNSFLSGILYLNNSDAKTLFAGENMWNYFKRTDRVMKISPEFNQELTLIHYEDCVAGKLILFPSNVIHMVKPNNSSNLYPVPNRYTISFNAFPSGKIGDMNFLSGLNIDIL